MQGVNTATMQTVVVSVVLVQLQTKVYLRHLRLVPLYLQQSLPYLYMVRLGTERPVESMFLGEGVIQWGTLEKGSKSSSFLRGRGE